MERPKTSIPVAVREMRIGEQITSADIRMQELSADSLPEGIVTDRTDIEGFYARDVILPGEPFREQRLAKKEDLSLSFNLPDGYRAVSLFVNESNLLSMQVLTGDYVDVIASWSLKTKEGDEVQLTKTVLQNIEILALGPNRALDDKAGLPSREGYSVDDMPKTVTLAVTPEQAEVLVFNAQFSSFTLALRGMGDEGMDETDGAVVIDMIPERFMDVAVQPGEASGTSSGGTQATGGGTGTEPTAP